MGMDYSKIDQWILAEDSFDPVHLGKCEAVMSLGNGYLGLRSAAEERYVGETRDLLINGTFDRFDESEVTELPNAADVTAVELWVGGERFSLDQGSCTGYSRKLNLKTGELTRRVEWTSPKGDKVVLVFRRIVSLKRLHDIALSVT
ncbi:MAG: glycoside hydrolase family 65 protein, partial [Clostridiales bacterium]|nr:glycoside hydrolase family 65 protein [Clostridiales bacterium]